MNDRIPTEQAKYVFLDDEIIPWAEANVHISTHALLYGTGCYEGMRAYADVSGDQVYLFRGEEHFQRLLDSCKLLLIRLGYSIPELIDITRSVVQKNEYRCDLYIRPVAYKKFGPQFIGVDLYNVSDGYFLLLIPRRPPGEIETIRVGTSTWRRSKDSSLPPRGKFTGSYIGSNLAKAEAIRNGHDDGLFLTEEGYVAEATTSNLFMVRKESFVTPPVYSDILEGITRDTIIQICKDTGSPIEERPIHRTELYVADEVFICGTAAEIKAVAEVDGRVVGEGRTGEKTRRIGEAYKRIVRGEVEKYRSFLIPLY